MLKNCKQNVKKKIKRRENQISKRRMRVNEKIINVVVVLTIVFSFIRMIFNYRM